MKSKRGARRRRAKDKLVFKKIFAEGGEFEKRDQRQNKSHCPDNVPMHTARQATSIYAERYTMRVEKRQAEPILNVFSLSPPLPCFSVPRYFFCTSGFQQTRQTGVRKVLSQTTHFHQETSETRKARAKER